VSGECEPRAEEETNGKEKRRVTVLSDKSERAMRTAAVQRHCGVNELAVWFIRR
jgi:hypothetical protein